MVQDVAWQVQAVQDVAWQAQDVQDSVWQAWQVQNQMTLRPLAETSGSQKALIALAGALQRLQAQKLVGQ